MPDAIGKGFPKIEFARADSVAKNAELQLGKLNNSNNSNGIQKPKMSEDQIHKAAADFEALLLHKMLQDMWKNVGEGGVFSEGGREGEIYADMLNEAVAKAVSEGKGIGIRDVIARDLSRLQGKK